MVKNGRLLQDRSVAINHLGMATAAANRKHEVAPEAWVPPDRAAFPAWLASTFRYEGERDAAGFFKQQRFVRDYMQHDAPYRGLVLYHGLGSGKTAGAIAASEALRGRGRRVFVMLPASLEPNYVKEVKKFGGAAYAEQRAWRFVAGKAASGPDADAAAAEVPDDARLRRRLGGVWVDDPAAGVPFDRLSPDQRDQVQDQVSSAVRRTHRFIKYNGLNGRTVAELADAPGIFDDAVIVVDEVHNFVSAVASGGLAARLYQKIMDARRCKVVLLSGTPLVNAPVELAYLVNLAHGYADVHEIALRPNAPAIGEAALKALDASPQVVEHHMDAVGGRQVLTARLAPEGFVRASPPDGFALVREAAGGTDGTAALRAAAGGDAAVQQHRVKRLLLLPVDPDAFGEAFVDAETNRLKNVDVLLRRTLGTVSYFRGHDASLYPRAAPPRIVRVPLSERQFAEYAMQRYTERRKEQLAARQAAKNKGGASGGDAVQQVYRAFSRAVCNFVFPADIPRPYRSAIRAAAAAMSAESPDEADSPAAGVGKDDATRRYLAALDAAVVELRAAPGRLALAADAGAPEGRLDELSPKYAEVVRRLVRNERGGTAIVYSQFRRAEGIGLLAASLDANGFSELRVRRAAPNRPGAAAGELEIAVSEGDAPGRPRYVVFSNDDPEASSVLLALFNGQFDRVPARVRRGLAALLPQAAAAAAAAPRRSTKSQSTAPALTNLRGELVRALLITKSGSEGIDTKNVREVHVLEPFWHAIRVQQVIGRAVRANSHEALPPAERTVDSYIYLATLTADQKRRDRTIEKLDGGLTSDEYVHDVATRKWRLVTEAMDVMRRAAVDCPLHTERHGKSIECYQPPAGLAAGDVLYTTDLAADLRAAKAR